MEASRHPVITRKRIVILLGGLFLFNLETAHGLGDLPTCKASVTARTYRCSSEVLSDRHVISGPHEGVDLMDCVRKCSHDMSCGLAVGETFSDGRETCNLLTPKGYSQGSDLDVSTSVTCKAAELNQCKNGGWMEDGICVCPATFKGEYCQNVNPGVCNPKWTKVFSFNKTSQEMTIHNSTLLDSAKYHVPKLRTRDDICSVWSLREIMDVHWKGFAFHPYLSLSKTCLDSYETNAKRSFLKYSTEKSYQSLEINDKPEGQTINNLVMPDSEIWTLDTSPFLEKIPLGPAYIDKMKQALQSGDKELFSNSILALDDDIFLSSTHLSMEFKEPAHTGSFGSEMKVFFSLFLCIMRPLYNFNGLVQFFTSKAIKQGQFFAYMDPCWYPVHQPLESPWMLRRKLIAYLNMGKDARLLLGRTYVDMVEAILEGDELYAVLDARTTSPGVGKFQTKAEQKYHYSFISSTGELISCVQPMESESNILRNRTSGPRPDWFVDARKWKEVYAVFSNGSVAKGERSELREAVNTVRTVRLKLSWLHLNRARYLDTIMSAVLDTGKVVTETRATWKLYDDKRPGLDFNAKCDQEILLVNSEGGIEVASFNVFTAGVSKVLTDDILITWFIN